MTETDATTEEAREYTKTALMRMIKPELIAVAGEIGVDLAVLPKLTKDSISDAIMVFLEPYLDDESVDTVPAEPIVNVSDEEIELEESIEAFEPSETDEPIEDEESVELEDTEEPSGPAPTVMSGSHQEILRPVKVEQSVRVRRISESNK